MTPWQHFGRKSWRWCLTVAALNGLVAVLIWLSKRYGPTYLP